MAATLTLQRLALRRVSDADVVARAAAGDAVAFSEVYRRFQKRIYGYCLARTLDPDTAADATQEVFLRLLRADVESVRQPAAYLFQIARNVLIDAARKRSRTPEDGGLEPDSPAWDRLRATDTADEVLTRSEARDVFLALRTLRPRYRAAIVMRDVHGESAADMAAALDSTPGAVDTLVSRARDAFAIAYASVRDLPQECRAATELMYRAHGSGISSAEQFALDAHLSSCRRCSAEAAKANDPRHLSALLPFLLPAKRTAATLLQRAVLATHGAPEIAVQQVAAVASQPHGWNLAMRLGAGALAIAAVAAPVALGPLRRSPAPVASAETGVHHPSVMQAYQHETDHRDHMIAGVCTDDFWSEQRAGHASKTGDHAAGDAQHKVAGDTHSCGTHSGDDGGSHSTSSDHDGGSHSGGMTTEPSHSGSDDESGSTHDGGSADPSMGGSTGEPTGEHSGSDSGMSSSTDSGMGGE